MLAVTKEGVQASNGQGTGLGYSPQRVCISHELKGCSELTLEKDF